MKTIQFNDVTLRDGQQSIAATRMTTAQALRVLPHLVDAGFPTLELWGGAILDSCVRYLNEDPWARLEAFRQSTGGRTRIRALLRGQNLFGYQPYPDDLVIEFIKTAVRSGVGVMRVFDALNDWRNLQTALLAVRTFGAVAEGALSYTTSPVHTTAYYVDYARKLLDEGAEQIAIKDMAGILYPWDAVELIRALKAAVDVPLVLHTHDTAGVGTLDAVLAMMEGVDQVDCAVTPFAGGSSHPPVEVLVVFAEALGLSHGLDVKAILRAQQALFAIFEELRDVIPYAGHYYRPVDPATVDRQAVDAILSSAARGGEANLRMALEQTRAMMTGLGYPPHDQRMFESQVPGGMLSNLQNQLRSMGHPEILEEVMAEIPVVRRDVGYVPLVTPTSQIVGSQAVFNIVTGQRYSFLSDEFKMLLRGEFGRTPIPPNPALAARVQEEDGIPVKTYRPAAYLLPVLEDATMPAFAHSRKDQLLHLLLGLPAEQYLRQREAERGVVNPGEGTAQTAEDLA